MGSETDPTSNSSDFYGSHNTGSKHEKVDERQRVEIEDQIHGLWFVVIG